MRYEIAKNLLCCPAVQSAEKNQPRTGSSRTIGQVGGDNGALRTRVIVHSDQTIAGAVLNDIQAGFGIEVEPVQIAGLASNKTRVRLTERILTVRPVVVKESPKRGAVDVYIRRVADGNVPSHTALCVAAIAVGEVRIAITTECRLRSRGEAGRSVTLPVWDFALLHADEDVPGIV